MLLSRKSKDLTLDARPVRMAGPLAWTCDEANGCAVKLGDLAASAGNNIGKVIGKQGRTIQYPDQRPMADLLTWKDDGPHETVQPDHGDLGR